MIVHVENTPSHSAGETNGTSDTAKSSKAIQTASVSTKSTASAPRPAETHPVTLDGAVIAGIVCGVIGTLLMLALAVYFIIRNRKQRLARKKFEEERASRYGASRTSSTYKNDHHIQGHEFRMPPPPPRPPRPPPPHQSLSPSEANYGQTRDNTDMHQNPISIQSFTGRARTVDDRDMNEKWIDSPPVSAKTTRSLDPPALPIITITDQYLPLPESFLSLYPIQEATSLPEHHDWTLDSHLTPHAVSKEPSYNHVRQQSDTTTRVDEPSSPREKKVRRSPPQLTLQTHITESQELEEEKEPESPVLGVLNRVRISNGPQLPQISEIGRSRSESDKSDITVSTLGVPLVTDEELERLGVGLRI